MFTDNMDKVRSFVREGTGIHSNIKIIAVVMWVTFQTHNMMQEYTRYGIGKRPSISSEYIKLIFTNNSNRGNNDDIDQIIDWLEDSLYF